MPANYDNVNAVWADEAPLPSPQEALAGARKLVKLALTLGPTAVKPHRFRGKFKLTSGNRHTWTRGGAFYVNPAKTSFGFTGWKAIVHDIAHWAGRRLYPDAKPHDARVAFIERTLAEHVISSGWLDGKLRRPDRSKPSTGDKRQQRYLATLAAIDRWQRKQRRAQTALRKLAVRRGYYERTLTAGTVA